VCRHASGARDDRPELAAALSHCRAGDTLVVYRLDRLGRSLRALIAFVADLQASKVEFRSLSDSIDTDQKCRRDLRCEPGDDLQTIRIPSRPSSARPPPPAHPRVLFSTPPSDLASKRSQPSGSRAVRMPVISAGGGLAVVAVAKIWSHRFPRDRHRDGAQPRISRGRSLNPAPPAPPRVLFEAAFRSRAEGAPTSPRSACASRWGEPSARRFLPSPSVRPPVRADEVGRYHGNDHSRPAAGDRPA
jgi:Resolvase, N terminal domain